MPWKSSGLTCVVPIGSDHDSSPVRRTYIEESRPGLGVFSRRGFSACAGPRGYAKVESIKGTDWAKTMAWGGNSSGSYAYAGQDGMFGDAARGGHAVAMCGNGSNFKVEIYEPGEKVIIRRSDGSTSRSRGKVSDSKQGGIRYSDGNKRRIMYIDDDDDEGVIRHSRDHQRAIRYSYGDQRAIKYSEKRKKMKKQQKAIEWF